MSKETYDIVELPNGMYAIQKTIAYSGGIEPTYNYLDLNDHAKWWSSKFVNKYCATSKLKKLREIKLLIDAGNLGYKVVEDEPPTPPPNEIINHKFKFKLPKIKWKK